MSEVESFSDKLLLCFIHMSLVFDIYEPNMKKIVFSLCVLFVFRDLM